jgi:hypothetical protein
MLEYQPCQVARLSVLTEDGPVDHDGMLLLPLLVNEVQVESEADNFLNRYNYSYTECRFQPRNKEKRSRDSGTGRRKTERRKDRTSK